MDGHSKVAPSFHPFDQLLSKCKKMKWRKPCEIISENNVLICGTVFFLWFCFCDKESHVLHSSLDSLMVYGRSTGVQYKTVLRIGISDIFFLWTENVRVAVLGLSLFLRIECCLKAELSNVTIFSVSMCKPVNHLPLDSSVCVST